MKCETFTDQQGTSVEQRKKDLPTGIEPKTSPTPGWRSTHWATRTHGKQGHLSEFTGSLSVWYIFSIETKGNRHKIEFISHFDYCYALDFLKQAPLLCLLGIFLSAIVKLHSTYFGPIGKLTVVTFSYQMIVYSGNTERSTGGGVTEVKESHAQKGEN